MLENKKKERKNNNKGTATDMLVYVKVNNKQRNERNKDYFIMNRN